MTTTTIAKPSIERINKKVMLAKTWERGNEDSQNRLYEQLLFLMFFRNAEQESNKADQIV
jgi:hypothetical protein